MTNPIDALRRAAANEEAKAQDLRVAATRFAEVGSPGSEALLQAAAKAWTNAYHQRSRCEKHLREDRLGAG